MLRSILAYSAILLAGLLACPPGLHAQGITTAAITGFIRDASGQPAAAVSVAITHEPSGTKASTMTRANGEYSVSGLRVGGPYTIVASVTGASAIQRNIFLSLLQPASVDLALQSEVVTLEKFTVHAESDTLFDRNKIGAGSDYPATLIANVPSARANIQDVAQMDSRLYLGSLDQGGQLSAQGQNFRYNSLLIDGVQAVDPFGLNGNGFSSLRSPIPLESIASLSVDLTPYDVRRSGFTGVLLDAVTRSGTNETHGITYYEFTNQNLRAASPLSDVRDGFQEQRFGFGIGGPIVKDKLFYYFAFDDFKRDIGTPPAALFVPSPTALDAILTRAKALGYDAGNLTQPTTSFQKTYLAKLDWNISADQRLSFSYRRNYGQDVNFANFQSSSPLATSLSNEWYYQPRNTDSFTAQLLSSWTPNLRTEVNATYTTYDGSPKNFGAPFPFVGIAGVPGVRLDSGATTTGAVVLGTENSRQLNFLNTKEKDLNASAEYSFGAHTLSVGGSLQQTDYDNRFVQNAYGNYTFASPAGWSSGTPIAYTLFAPLPGMTAADAFARFRCTGLGAFVQDTWTPTTQLTLTGGLRIDYPYAPDQPATAAGFSTAGFKLPDGTPVTSNTTTLNGNCLIGPRLGFNYRLKTESKTQVRGGVGLFQGSNPAVWLSNSFSNTGAVNNINATPTQLASLQFQPNVNQQPVPAGTIPAPNINITAPDFKQPAIWKGNLAIDHAFSFGGLETTLEYSRVVTDEAINYVFLNYQVATSGPTVMPDGRIRYAGIITPTGTFASALNYKAGANGLSAFPNASVAGRRANPKFADVLYMENTKAGTGDFVTLELRRPIAHGWGWTVSYTHSHSTEVSPLTSSTAISNYSNRASFNPNEDTAATSNTNIQDRIVAQLEKDFHLFHQTKTTVALVYQGRTGHPYSYVFRGDANGDGITGNDLLYIPTGPNDPNVRWTAVAGATPTAAQTSERDGFFAFVNSNSLAQYAGSHAPRNSTTSPWINTVDLKFTQEIPISKRVKTEVYLNFLNIANWFNKKWGIQDEVPSFYKRAVAGSQYDPAGNGGNGQWIYTYNTSTLDPVATTVNDQPVSRWQVVLGARILF